MPFRLIYSVKFRNGNLTPDSKYNVYGWPDMQHSGDASAVYESDATGLNVRMTRQYGATKPGRASVFVAPVNNVARGGPIAGHPLDSRIRTRLIFDKPLAEELPTGPGHIGRTPPPPPPEAWAVALNVSRANDVSTPADLVNVTCQFSRTAPNGVRLNTVPPEGVSPLQDDKAAALDSPLDYKRYAKKPPAIFTLEHSFCGFGNRANLYTVGSGFLTIENRHGRSRVLSDHRVYTSGVFARLARDVPIGALGITLGTRNGIGRYAVHLKRFEVWEYLNLE